MQLEQKTLEQKCDKLAESCREKERVKQKLQKLYASLKQQHVAAGMEVAADHDAENVLEAAHHNTTNYWNEQPKPSRAHSNASGGSGRRPHQANAWQNRVQGSRAGLQSARESGHAPQLPSRL